MTNILQYNNAFIFEIFTSEIYEMFVHKHAKTTEYVKKQSGFIYEPNI